LDKRDLDKNNMFYTRFNTPSPSGNLISKNQISATPFNELNLSLII